MGEGRGTIREGERDQGERTYDLLAAFFAKGSYRVVTFCLVLTNERTNERATSV